MVAVVGALLVAIEGALGQVSRSVGVTISNK
jgi:hypothetical protein